MTRPLRFLMKKRGDRRTGSPGLGSLGAILIYGAALVTGVAMLGYMLWAIILFEWQVNQVFQETTARVIAKRLGVETTEQVTQFRPEVTIRYEVNGETYEQTTYDILRWYSLSRMEQQELLDQFTIGETYPVWYDPQEPERVVLVRDYRWWLWLALLIPVALILFGALRMASEFLRWNSSPERLSQNACSSPAAARPNSLLANLASSIPRCRAMTTSRTVRHPPGLSFADQHQQLGDARGGVRGDVILEWNLDCLRRRLYSRLDPRAGFLVLDAVSGAVLTDRYLDARVVVRAALITLGVGPTHVEISQHPWRAGGEYEIWFSQSGKLTLKHLIVELICEESVTYRQGTDTRTERCIVHRQTLFERQDFAIPEEAPLEEQVVCRIPATAMHSFEAPSNEIQWKLMVRAEIVSWPNFERSYSIVVQPAEPVAWIPHA